MVSRFTATMDWSTVWVSSDQKPLAVTDKSPGNPLNKTITLPNCATLRQTNSTDTLLACSRRSDNAVRREAREQEKNKGGKEGPHPSLFFMLTSLAPSRYDLNAWKRPNTLCMAFYNGLSCFRLIQQELETFYGVIICRVLDISFSDHLRFFVKPILHVSGDLAIP